ncbi:MAG: hypothetical protein CVV02_14910 [Firmicutes bacterium HGW-Firmicutes-7]|nr:MAG: hypothetical protein CVV02_14910 [Firmicutes bacterium HGW-Firmicutes-7]
MKNLAKRFIVLLLISIFLATALTSCKESERKDKKEDIENISTEEIQATQEAFDRYCEELAKKIIEESPLNASFMYGNLESLGLESLLYELDDVSNEATQKLIDDAKEVLVFLDSIKKKQLTKEQQKTYEMLVFHNEGAVAGANFTHYYNAFQPSSGVQINIPIALIQIELETETEVIAYIQRIKQLPRLFSQFLDYELERAEKGLTLPSNIYDTVIEQIEELLVEPESFMMYLSFSDRVDELQEITSLQKDKYKSEFLQIIKNEVYPSYEEMKISLGEIKTLTENTRGLAEWENGQEYYNYLVKYGTSYNMNAEDLRRWAEKELTRSSAEIQKYLMKYPAFAEQNLSEVLPKINSIDTLYEMQNQFMEEFFMDYGVLRASDNVIPSYLEEHMPPAFYFPISIDGEDYGNMYMTEEAFSNISMETFMTDIHENIPGHHLYFSILYGSDLPLIRKVYDFSAYTEGWAQYVQGKTYEFSTEDEELAQFWRHFLIFNAAYSVILDIQVNYDGMPKQEAINNMVMFGYDQDSAQTSYNRMLANPGEMIDYYYGSYVINGYLEECMNREGDDFNIKEFHDLMLQSAGLPFTTMDKVVKEYLKK